MAEVKVLNEDWCCWRRWWDYMAQKTDKGMQNPLLWVISLVPVTLLLGSILCLLMLFCGQEGCFAGVRIRTASKRQLVLLPEDMVWERRKFFSLDVTALSCSWDAVPQKCHRKLTLDNASTSVYSPLSFYWCLSLCFSSLLVSPLCCWGTLAACHSSGWRMIRACAGGIHLDRIIAS